MDTEDDANLGSCENNVGPVACQCWLCDWIRTHLGLDDTYHVNHLVPFMRSLTTEGPPPSSGHNLTNFLMWAKHEASHDELLLASFVVYTIEHRAGWGPVAPVTLDRPDLGLWNVQVTSLPCTDPYCDRCREGRGGYQFFCR